MLAISFRCVLMWTFSSIILQLRVSLTHCHALASRKVVKIMWFTHAYNDMPQVCQLVPSAVPGAVSGRLWQLNCRLGFWKTVDNYYSLLGERTSMCSVREATSVTTITKSLLIINIAIKIVINLDKNHNSFSAPAHWSDQVVASKSMLCHSCLLCASLHTLIVFGSHRSTLAQTNTCQ